MTQLEFRTLKPDEIDVRVGGQAGNNGFFLLLYKDARCDMKLLDETVGPLNWQREHDLVDGQLFCTVSIYDENKGQWISKQDVGVESNTDAEKGRASDSFKRACTNFGIGRELYTAPFIYLKGNVKEEKRSKFRVKEIKYDEDRNITELEIEKEINYQWQTVFKRFKDQAGKWVNRSQNGPRNGNRQAQGQDRGKLEAMVVEMFNLAKESGVEAKDIQAEMYAKFEKEKTANLTEDEIGQMNAWIFEKGLNKEQLNEAQ